MKVPPVDNTGTTPTGKNAPTQADTVKKAEFDTVMKEVMAILDELRSIGATPPDVVKKADLDQVMEEVYNGLRELHYRSDGFGNLQKIINQPAIRESYVDR